MISPLSHTHTGSCLTRVNLLTPPAIFAPIFRAHTRHEWLYNGVICTCNVWFLSRSSFRLRLAHISRSNLLWGKVSNLSNNMERFNYLVPNTNWMVEMPLTGGQYHQAIAFLWISRLVDNLALTPLMIGHIASAQLTHSRQITSQSGIISLFSKALEKSLDLPLPLLNFRNDFHFPVPLWQLRFHHILRLGITWDILTTINFRLIL